MSRAISGSASRRALWVPIVLLLGWAIACNELSVSRNDPTREECSALRMSYIAALSFVDRAPSNREAEVAQQRSEAAELAPQMRRCQQLEYVSASIPIVD